MEEAKFLAQRGKSAANDSDENTKWFNTKDVAV